MARTFTTGSTNTSQHFSQTNDEEKNQSRADFLSCVHQFLDTYPLDYSGASLGENHTLKADGAK